jgi:hypothetical protein
MTHLLNIGGGVGGGGRTQGGKPQPPTFCRARRPTTTVYLSRLRDLYRLLLLVLVLQLSTLLLVNAGSVPPRLIPSSTNAVLRPDAVTTTGWSPSLKPISQR